MQTARWTPAFKTVSADGQNHPCRVEIGGLKITHLEKAKGLAKSVLRRIDFEHGELSQDGSDTSNSKAQKPRLVEAAHGAGTVHRPKDRAQIFAGRFKITHHFDPRLPG